jgi:transcriptional regulator GlxA family with amidase domain
MFEISDLVGAHEFHELPDAVAAVANRFLPKRDAFRVDNAAASAGLSVRQFERRFAEQVAFRPDAAR